MSPGLLSVCLLAVLTPRASSTWDPYRYEADSHGTSRFSYQYNAPLDRDREALIYFGEEADIEDYPYMVSITAIFPSKYSGCGGIILNSYWILSAAHCFRTDEGETPLKVNLRAGSAHRLLGMEHVAVKIVMHQDFQSGYKMNNDIAVLKVYPDFQFNGANIGPANLFPKDIKRIGDGQIVTIVGWGMKEDGEPSDVLLKVDMKIIKLERCYSFKESHACAAPISKKSGPCMGDSGGPLIAEGYVFGIAVAVLNGCGSSSPSIFTRVNYYSDWIDEKITM